MKMAGLLWMSVILSVLLLESCSCISENQLAPMVDAIWKNYKINKMFSIATSIPNNQNQEDKYDMSQVLNAENAETVKTAMKKKQVYMHGRIVAAMVIPDPDIKGEYLHAEYRVLQNLDNLLNQQFDFDNDLMLFYVRAAPCVQKCTDENNPQNILKYLPKLKRWTHYAFAFSGLYLSKNPQKSLSTEQRRTGIQKVADSLGLNNVFRCVESNGQMQCRTCKDQNNQVAGFCFSDHEWPQSDEGNSVAPAVSTPLKSAPDNAEAGNRMIDEPTEGGATEGNEDNASLEASSSQTPPENDAKEGEQARRREGGRVGRRRGGRGRVGRRRGGKGRTGRKRGGRGRVGRRRGGRGRVGKTRGGRGRVGRRRGGRGRVGRRRGGKGRTGRKRGGRGRVGRRRGGRGRVGRRRGGRGRTGRKRGGRGRVGRRRGGRGRTGRKRGGRGRVGRRRGGRGRVGRRRGGRGRTGRKRGGRGRVGRRRGGRGRIGRRRGGRGWFGRRV